MKIKQLDSGHGAGPLRRRGPGLRQSLAIMVTCLSLLVAGMVAFHLGGGSAPGIAFAAGCSDAGPVADLGSTFGQAGCTSAALGIGEGWLVFCDDWSAITSKSGTALVVSLYAAGNPVVGEYAGCLPQALEWGATISDVADQLGAPRRITDMYGTPTLVYMYDAEKYGSLELQFDARDELVRINAGLTH